MAYSTLLSLQKTIDQILNDDRYSMSPRGKQHIIPLTTYVISFISFLEDFPEKAKYLEARIRDVAMEVEDIIELFMIKQIEWKRFKCTRWISALREIKLERQVEKGRAEMDSITREVVEVSHSIITRKDAKLDDFVRASSSSSSQVADAGKFNIVGLDEDLIEIMGWLCGNSPQLQILPITGMGGIGKTTLARNAYDDPLITECFDIRVWVTISQDYSERRFISDILNAMKGFVAQNSEESIIEKAERVYKTLVGRKFLIVIDDIWSKNILDDAKKLFPDNRDGSRILLTTRLADVAAYANSSTPSHQMRLMDADQSWNLLRQKVFKDYQYSVPRALENIGREIARSCGGLPLAIVAAAGVLSTVSMAPTAWNKIAGNLKSTLGTPEGQIEKILSLSYNHLPHYLRPCFLYMGVFPEDDQIKAVELMRLWIAEGFVKEVALKSYEDSAEEYMEDLIKRNLVIVTENNPNGKIKICRLHDLVRDLCIKLSHEEKFLFRVNDRATMASMKNERRISIYRSGDGSLASEISSRMRTILFFRSALDSYRSFRLLWVLDVKRLELLSTVIVDQFFELYHLRYLAFCYSSRIPRAISNLQSLQTLIIRGDRYGCIYLPHEIWSMPQLRHIIILYSNCFLDYPCSDAAVALENLQTLGTVSDLGFTLSILHRLPNLKKLSVICTWLYGELLFHNLVHLHRLEQLKLEAGSIRRSAVCNLVVPSSLKKLTLTRWGGIRPCINIVGPLPNLQVLKLRKFDFMQQEWTTGDEDFPKLRLLLIDDSNLKKWNSEGSHFPMLKHLLIHSCRYLNEIPDDFGDIPTLKLIGVKKCHMSLANHVKLMQEEQLNYGDDVFQVRCS